MLSAILPGSAWHPGVNDQWINYDFDPRVLPLGAVASWGATGAIYGTHGWNAFQDEPTLRPTRLSDGSVEFQPGQSLTYPKDYAEPRRYTYVRFIAAVVSVDQSVGSGATTLFSATGAGSTPGVTGDTSSGALQHRNDGPGSLVCWWHDWYGDNPIAASGLTSSYATKALVMLGHMDGRLFAWFNDGDPVPFEPNILFAPAKNDTIQSVIGDTAATGVRWKLWRMIHLATEPNDDLRQKLQAHLMRRYSIPMTNTGHPYYASSPRVTALDFPSEQTDFSASEWAAAQACKAALSVANRGNPIPSSATTNFNKRIFYEDWRSKSLSRSDSQIVVATWYAGGGGFGGTTVGGLASLSQPTDVPDCYPYDGVAKKLGLRAQRTTGGSLRAGAISTVDLMDNGITFRFPNQRFMLKFTFWLEFGGNGKAVNCWFPATPWFYGNQREKRANLAVYELDTVEIDSANYFYLNCLSTFMHPGNVLPAWNNRLAANQNFKMLGHEMKTTTFTSNPLTATIDFGASVPMEGILLADGTYIYLSVAGQEMGRWPQHTLWRRRVHMNLDQSISSGTVNGVPRVAPSDPADYCDMATSKIEVYLHQDDIALAPAPFTARPTISPSATIYPGMVLTMSPNLPSSISLLRGEWYESDGYPTAGRGMDYVAEVGKAYFGKVQGRSHPELPESFTATTSTCASAGNPITSADLNFAAGSYVVNGTTYTSWAALSAACPWLCFSRKSRAALGATVYARHAPRIGALGLLYEGFYNDAASRSPIDPLTWKPSRGRIVPANANGPLGVNTVGSFAEDSTTNTHALSMILIAQVANGDRVSGAFWIRPRNRSWLAIGASSGAFGTGASYFNLSGSGAKGTQDTGVTSSVSLVPGYTDVYEVQWSKISGGVGTVAVILYPATGNGGNNYAGTDGLIAFDVLAGMVTNSGLTRFPQMHLVAGRREADQFAFPCGSGKTLTCALDDGTGNASTQTLNPTGDYVLPLLNAPFLKRLQIA